MTSPSGMAEQFDPRAALVVSENEKREAMAGEQESGDPKDKPSENSPIEPSDKPDANAR